MFQRTEGAAFPCDASPTRRIKARSDVLLYPIQLFLILEALSLLPIGLHVLKDGSGTDYLYFGVHVFT